MKRRQHIRKTLLLFLFLVFPVTFIFMSPYLMVLGASERVVSAGLLFWMLAFLLSFLIGRGFCGWFCPLGAEQMLVDQAVNNPLSGSGTCRCSAGFCGRPGRVRPCSSWYQRAGFSPWIPSSTWTGSRMRSPHT